MEESKASISANDITAKSWLHLVELLHADSFDTRINRYRSRYAFRGLSNSEYDLKTSLIRLGHDPKVTRDLEPVILRSFRKYAHLNATPGTSIWHWLSLAQHHGLPTRLLDWSVSPYVALHFATEDPDKFKNDPKYQDLGRPNAVIWCVDIVLIQRQLPDALRDLLAEYKAQVFYVEMLEKMCDTLARFDALAERPFPMFFEPPSLDNRIVNQFALFSMLSDPTAQLESWLAEHLNCVKRILIPEDLMWEVRDKLDQMNLTERVIYPGLDGLSKWLRRYYAPRK